MTYIANLEEANRFVVDNTDQEGCVTFIVVLFFSLREIDSLKEKLVELQLMGHFVPLSSYDLVDRKQQRADEINQKIDIWNCQCEKNLNDINQKIIACEKNLNDTNQKIIALKSQAKNEIDDVNKEIEILNYQFRTDINQVFEILVFYVRQDETTVTRVREKKDETRMEGEGEGELIPLSKFKLQLLSLLSESRHIREREGGVREELGRSNEKLKQIEAESDKQVGELRAELDSRRDFQKKLELRVKYLENENGLLEKKEKDLKDAINGLLHSRESFIRHYEDSNCSLQRTIQMKNKEISLLSEKLNAHISLFNSVEKEANSVKRALDGVKRTLNEKEQVVAGLNDKVGRVCTLEKDFVEKINSLETKLTDCKLEIRRKNAQISELEEKIESEKLSNDSKSQIEELRRTVLVKEETIERLSSEKQSMRDELHYMELIIQRFQEIFSKLKTEDKQVVSPVQQDMEQTNSLENNVEQIQPNINNEEINMDLNNEGIIKDCTDQTDKNGEDDNQQLEKESSENHVSSPSPTLLPKEN
ncbi:hypothetical protein LUZ60_006075 [Juncus effusus]|nr:hypothetical protein LUZ60_006075 [Juncus effusus]